MSDRYIDRLVLLNRDPLYEDYMEQRNKKFIRQYATPVMRYPTAAELADITRFQHIWSAADRYYKLAIRHYGSARYWWVIAFFNMKPTEADITVGESIVIPLPLENILRVYEA
jgi:mannose-6-phosphate isomerase-like protein (cupin superfamily)